MNSDDLRRLLAGQTRTGGRSRPAAPADDGSSYTGFHASELYCAQCKRAVKTKERHLLYLPKGDLFDYTCPVCGSSLGSRTTG